MFAEYMNKRWKFFRDAAKWTEKALDINWVSPNIGDLAVHEPNAEYPTTSMRRLIKKAHTFAPGSPELRKIRAWAETQPKGRTRKGAARLLYNLNMRQVEIGNTLRMSPSNVNKYVRGIRKI
jgi:hypothetical protein